MYVILFVHVFLSYICTNKGFLITGGLQKVSANAGEIVGFTDRVKFDNNTFQVRKFLGIPYAEPPIGKLRFEKPIKKQQFITPFKADRYSPKCPQLQFENETMSEDCLYLNIFAPEISNMHAPNTPVMIWLHGGGFLSGYSKVYEGDVISVLGDVIVVTINYRLGPLGFFSIQDSTAKGNYGLWDQHLAIRWVYENIAAFGGDKTNITLFGESAGSSSVIYQMLYPGNKGLFKKAIAESGTIAGWAISYRNSSYDSSLEFAKLLDCRDVHNISECLQSKTEADVINATLTIEMNYNEVNRSWVPVFDDEFVLAKTPDILSELSNQNFRSKYSNYWDVDLMIGSTNYDGISYLDLMMYYVNNYTTNSISYKVSAEKFNTIIVHRAVEAWLGELPNKLAIDLAINEYTDWGDPTNNTKRLQSTIDILTDYVFNVPMIYTARSHANVNTSTYMYRFAAAPPKRLLRIAPELDGPGVACHTDELPYLFGFTANLRESWKNFPESIIGEKDFLLSREIINMWTNFAKSGNPNIPAKLGTLNAEEWPMFEAKDELYLEIAPRRSYIKQRLRTEQAVFWNNVLPEIQGFGNKPCN